MIARDGPWFKLLVSKSKVTLDAISTIKATLLPVVLSAIMDDSNDDENAATTVVDDNSEDDNNYGDEDD